MNLIDGLLQSFGALKQTKDWLNRRKAQRDIENLLADWIMDSNLPDRTTLAENVRKLMVVEKLTSAGSEDKLLEILRRFGIFQNRSISTKEGELLERLQLLLVQHYGNEGEKALANRIESLHEKVDRQDGVFEQVRLTEKLKHSPAKTLADLAHDELRGYNIEQLILNPDTSGFSVKMSKPFAITVQGEGEGADLVSNFYLSLRKYGKAKIEISHSSGVRLTTDSKLFEKLYPQALTSDITFMAIEQPLEAEKIIRYSVGDYSTAVATRLIYERHSDELQLILKTSEHFSFKFTIYPNKNLAGFTSTISLEQSTAPTIHDLNVLKLLSCMTQIETLELSYESTSERIGLIDLSTSSDDEKQQTLIGLAGLASLFLEAESVLQRRGLIDRSLPWPRAEDWGDPEFIRPFQWIVTVLVKGDKFMDLSTSGEFLDVYCSHEELLLIDGRLHTTVAISHSMDYGSENFLLKRTVVMDKPQVEMSHGELAVNAESIRGAFDDYGSPLKVTFIHEKSEVRYEKVSRTEWNEDQPKPKDLI